MSDHLAYVTASYAVAGLTVAGLILWVILDGRARRRELAVLDASGIRRRSEGGA
ncbi:heme exporter protein CcmD [Ensifer soli]|uniref:heme exporter protein CcmD n=1 Tax=Ciceribacter sp. sgz301302 TaxID=3342379 RepID=UPI0035BA3C0A